MFFCCFVHTLFLTQQRLFFAVSLSAFLSLGRMHMSIELYPLH